MNNKLGLVSISFRKNTVEEIFEAVKGAGLSCIEWGSDVHAPYNDSQKLQKSIYLCVKVFMKNLSQMLHEKSIQQVANYSQEDTTARVLCLILLQATAREESC